ncbi:MAG TPA: integrase arm-type DNA-binding domain-containing protein [Afifellaceae bacterium]|nr:integrase arm-type DNA-binding domain-containing protein [Afifellaceae bacterium]
MAGHNKLSAAGVNALKKPGRYADGLGLYLQVAKSETKDGNGAVTKSWLFRFQHDGKARQMGLGPLHTVSLADARQKAGECRRMLLKGTDPIEARQAARAHARTEAAKGISFRQCAERYITAHEAAWRNDKHRAQWRSTLAAYCYPAFGDLPVAAVDTGLVLKVLEPIWTSKPETASRIRGRIESVLDWATVRGYRSGENPARWRGHLAKLLPARSKVARIKHHAALPYGELPAFMEDLRGRDGSAARALEFAILTAGRTSEVIGARWSEIDLAATVWIISPERMKSGREHRVPLSERAVELLERLPREKDSDFVFMGGRKGRPLSNMALLVTLRRMGRGDLTAHGFRSTFRDWAAETTGYQSEVVEMALAHAIGSKVEAAYRRGDLFEKRRVLMEAWSRFVMSGAGDVVYLRPAASAG